MRCNIKRCKKRITPQETVKYKITPDDDILKSLNDRDKAIKVYLCIECAKLYAGIYWQEDYSYSWFTELTEMEFGEELAQDLISE